MGSSDFIVPLMVLISSPVMLIGVTLFGVGALFAIISIALNPYFIAANLLVLGTLFALDRLSAKTIAIGAAGVGFVFWMLALQHLFSTPLLFGIPLGAGCGLPFIGGLFCGGIAAFTISDFVGYFIAGMIWQGIIGALLLFKEKK